MRALGLDTLEGKLIAAFAALAVGALVLGGAVYVALSSGKEQQREIDHVVATAPTIHNGFLRQLLSRSTEEELVAYVNDAATAYDLRILMFDGEGLVVEDTGGKLAGATIEFESAADPPKQGTQTWEAVAGEDQITLVAPFPSTVVFSQAAPAGFAPRAGAGDVMRGRGEVEIDPYSLAIVVPEDTLARAWLGLLPGLLIAAGVAIPISAAFGVLTARHITRPLHQLTEASHEMAAGSFDVHVAVDRQDEVGELAKAFSAMAENVGSAHRQMSTMLANVSHDVRTPLTSILGFAQALRTGVVEGDKETRRVGGVIYEEAERLTSRLTDLIYLSEIESGQAVLQKEKFDLGELVTDRLAPMRVRAEGRGVEISAQIADETPVEADRAKIERAIDNLLDNACKYAPESGEVRVRTWLEDGRANVEVANEARDLTEDELSRLFERFYRSARNGAIQPLGSGLGLPIAKDLVEMHGGELSAALRDGEIAFVVSLPG